MADNEQKRMLINRALLVYSGAKTMEAAAFYDDLDDNYFSDPFTNVPDGRNDILAICISYEKCLLEVLSDLRPEFALKYADLGAEISINKEFASWTHLFKLPSDYDSRLKDSVKQVSQNNKKKTYDFAILHYESYAHVVEGSDDQAYYCSSDHTGAASTKPITGASYATYWSLYDEDGSLGADHQTGWLYKSSQTSDIFLTNTYSNDPSTTVDSSIDSAYIEYIPYTLAGINDKPEYYPEAFCRPFIVRLASDIAIAVGKDQETADYLIKRYQQYEKPIYMKVQQSPKHIEKKQTILEARTA